MQKLLKQFYQTSVTGCELKGDKDFTFPPRFSLATRHVKYQWSQVENALSQAGRVCHGVMLVVCTMPRAKRPGYPTTVKYFTYTAPSTSMWNYSVCWRILDPLAGRFFSFSCGFVAKLTPNKWGGRAVILLSLQAAMAALLQEGSALEFQDLENILLCREHKPSVCDAGKCQAAQTQPGMVLNVVTVGFWTGWVCTDSVQWV